MDYIIIHQPHVSNSQKRNKLYSQRKSAIEDESDDGIYMLTQLSATGASNERMGPIKGLRILVREHKVASGRDPTSAWHIIVVARTFYVA